MYIYICMYVCMYVCIFFGRLKGAQSQGTVKRGGKLVS